MDARVALTLRTLGGLTDARDRPGLPRPRADPRPAPRPGQAQDPRRRDPLSRAAGRAPARAARRRPARPLPRVQRGLRGVVRRRADPPRAVRRGDPAGAGRGRRCCPTSPRRSGCWPCMLLHDARRDARVGPGGDLVLLDDQDRAELGHRPDRGGTGARGVAPWRGAGPVRTSSRPRSPPCTTRRRRPPTPTGRRSPRSTSRSSG